MKTRTIIPILILALAGFTACGGGNESDSGDASNIPDSLKTDAQLVEEAVFTDLQGAEVSVSDFQGKVVLIDFWETWCSPCLATFPVLQRLVEEFPERFVVLAVTPGMVDTKEDARAFVEKKDYDFQFLWDANNLSGKLGVQGIPFKVYLDASGTFIEKSLGSYGPEKEYQVVRDLILEHGSEPGTYREELGQLYLERGGENR